MESHFKDCPITETSVPERCSVKHVRGMISYLATWDKSFVF